MAKVLVIKTSMIEDGKSVSNALNDLYVEEYKKLNPNDEFIYLNLNDEKELHVVMTRDNLASYTKNSDKYIDQLRNVNKVIISVPMTNFNINAVTKAYFDHINVANKTFSYKYTVKGEAMGLLDHLDVQILTTQGAPYGWYTWGNHTAYLEGQFGFFGAKTSEPILLAGTKLDGNPSKDPKEVALIKLDDVKRIVKKFASIPERENQNLAKIK